MYFLTLLNHCKIVAADIEIQIHYKNDDKTQKIQ